MDNQANITEKYNEFIDIKDVGQAENIASMYKSANPDDVEGLNELLEKLLEGLMHDDKELTGSADDFHNFAVTISKNMNENYNTMLVVKKGLLIHPQNTDLLADALSYGYNTEFKKNCEDWWITLQSVNMSLWSWRAFSFSIDYLLDELNADYSEYKLNKIIDLAKDYQKYKPDNEDAWISECDIYRKTNKSAEAMSVLEKAIKKFNFCPKCWLRYADLMQESGCYDKALEYVLKIRKRPFSANGVNMAYVYYLEGLCRYTLLVETDDYDDGNIDEKEVLRIYKAFANSKNSKKGTCRWHDEIDDCIAQLFNDTGVENTFESN